MAVSTCRLADLMAMTSTLARVAIISMVYQRFIRFRWYTRWLYAIHVDGLLNLLVQMDNDLGLIRIVVLVSIMAMMQLMNISNIS